MAQDRLRLALLLLLFPASALAAPGDNDVGLNVHNGTPAFVDAAADLGVTWVRMDANWFSLETAPNVYQWTLLDAAVSDAVASGLNVYLTLAYTPSWVPRHGDTDGNAGNDVPNASTEWTNFVTNAVTHYRALGVTHFGLWNEANLQGFWEGSLEEYATIIVNPGATALRAACADCVVLGPDLANVGDADDALEEVLMRTPGAWDIITHHIYQDFEETGWRIWDGDSYINVLDDQRFTFTRRDLRQLLDDAGWTGDVWITETGYRATPIGDAGEEQLQAIYVRRALEEQLQRAWVTNTFFYEVTDCGVDQPTCTIDGFGLMRPTGGVAGQRTFPGDFRLKPAFAALKQFIVDNPAVVSATPPPECGDGIDNDGDGRVDGDDRGCSGAEDDDESDDPPRMRINLPVATPTIDGDPSEFMGWMPVPTTSWRGTEELGADDHAVRIAAAWDASNLYFGIEVTDDVHDNDAPLETMWMGDSVQLAFDPLQTGGTGYDADDHELTYARSTDGSTTRVFREQGTGPTTMSVVSMRQGTTTSYEIAIPHATLPQASWFRGELIGFSFLVNDADGAGRVGWTEWTAGIGAGKEPERYGELFLLSPVMMRDGGVPDSGEPRDAAPPDDGSVGRDAGPTADGGVADGGRVVRPPLLTPSPPEAEDGCACTNTTRTSSGITGLLWLGFALTTRRASRRRRAERRR
ncbi:MAG: sugar-binding protein [Deltaproteobacteria bacterium]